MIPLKPVAATAPAGPSSAAHGPAQLHHLLAAPHRLGFFAGLVMVVVASLWWAAVLALRHAGVAVPWQVSPTTAHALLMVYGFLPFFFVGFLFTAGPRWLMVAPVPARDLVGPVTTMAAGWLLTLVGVHAVQAVSVIGLALVALGFALLSGRFALLVMQSRVADLDHARVVLAGCAMVVLGLLAAALGLALGLDALPRAAARFGLWGGIAVVFVAVAHRMVPFFTASALPMLDAWRPRALLAILVALVGVQAPWAAADALLPGTGGPLELALRAVVELVGGAWLLWLAVRWGLMQSLRIRLLAMLHMGFVWLGVAFALAGVSHALMVASGGTLSLGLAPLHALTMGYLGSTLVAMATRVMCGHSGRTLVADNLVWTMFWVLQAAVLCRLVAALWLAAQVPFTLLAAHLWVAALVAWALRYARWLLQPRSDGQPG
ncbi:MAG TPA: NnrS family protein [Burkholderiaceae bacterium]|nr:NnrS family protein [Burkholderiaceae bacterium]